MRQGVWRTSGRSVRHSRKAGERPELREPVPRARVDPFNPVPTVLATLGLAILAAGGCSADQAAPEGFEIATRDSAQVRIVDIEGFAPGALPTWDLAGPPELEIGGEGTDPDYVFHRVRSGTRLNDGGIAVANSGSAEIRVYDARGRHRVTLGGRGRGPGEFAEISWLRESGPDTLVAFDVQLRRLTWFSPNGRVLRTVGLEPAGGGFGDPEALGLVTEGFAARSGFDRMFGVGERRDTVQVYLFDDGGRLVDSIGSFPGPERYFHRQDGAAFQFSPILGRDAYLHSEAGRVVAGSSDHYTFEVFEGGKLAMRVRTDWTSSAADVGHAVDHARRELEKGAWPPFVNIGEIFPHIPQRPTVPAFGELRLDTAGGVWVKAYPLGDGPQRWTVFDAAGRPAARVEIPASLSILQIHPEWVLAVKRDEFEVESIVLLKLERGP
jgi:hypothetical protein